ncbi:MAG TPA: hypothetical protein VLJ58_06645, partial [Ramlibacter sp.]|nr:hypothetical protein [Ramlibacter sp.]
MAVLTLYRALGSSTPPFIGTVSIAESDHLQLVAGTVTLDYYGFGLSYSEATVTGGTVTGYEVRNTAQAGLLFSVAGLNLAAATFFELARGGQPDAISATLFGGDDTLIGSPGADSLQGQGGSDSISGGAGNDTLVGNDDDLADTLAGGNGNDLYLVGAGGHGSTDVVVELEGGGIDRVESPTSYTLGANVEQLVLAGSGASTGTGNALANLLIGT